MAAETPAGVVLSELPAGAASTEPTAGGASSDVPASDWTGKARADLSSGSASTALSRAELRAWLQLLQAPELGRQSARRLLAAFGSPEAVVDASPAARRAVVGAARAAGLDATPDGLDSLVEATLRWWQAEGAEPRHILTLGHPRYPTALLQSADPPLLLYVQGSLDLLSADAVAIVGSRNPTPQGTENARSFARGLGDAGFVVVSGLALGIDTAAHEGALDGPSGTVAVVGTGPDRVYPARNRALAGRIARAGAIVSEFAVGTPPLPQHFPMRNRIIAGLSRGTLVVEAALRSGSLVTARLALESNREVFAVPGSIHSPQSRGCHALIRQGAKLAESVDDILEELQPQTRPAARSEPVDEGVTSDPVLAVIGFDPVSLDALVARSGLAPGELQIRLLDLELDGQVARLPGQLFQRLKSG